MEKPYLVWKKSMEDRLRYERVLQEEAQRANKNPNYKPRVKIGKKNKELFERFLKREREIENKRRKRKRRKNR